MSDQNLEHVDRDEGFSWNAATVIMLLYCLFALTMTLLALNPFTLLFNVALVYLPTVILLGSAIFGRTRLPS